MATTAVGFRRGDTNDNNSFAGVTGEIVADLGNGGNIDDGKATIILHRGDGIAGGIRMAREDFANLTDQAIYNLVTYEPSAEGSAVTGLLYNDLRNIKTQTQSAYRSNTETILKTDYSIASKDGHDLSTYLITGTSEQITNQAPGGGPYVATTTLNNLTSDGDDVIRVLAFKYWLANINTSYLATGTYTYQGQPYTLTGNTLAYSNMSNVNTADLATSGSGHSGLDLAYANLTNVGYQTIVDYIDAGYELDQNPVKLQNYEWVDNKKTYIDPYGNNENAAYPNAQAMIDYCSFIGQNYANTRLDNIVDWRIASAKDNVYKINVDIEDGGSGYSDTGSASLITTNIAHPDGGYVQIKVRKVDDNGVILEASLEYDRLYANSPLSPSIYTDPVNGAMFTIYSPYEEDEDHQITGYIPTYAGKLMLTDLSNSDIKNSSNTTVGSIKYTWTEEGGALTYIDSVIGQLSDSTTQTAGSFSVERETTGVEAKISSSDLTSSATATQTVGTSLSDLAVTVATFESQFVNTPASGIYTFTFDGSDWYYDSNVVTIANYGISFTGTPVANDEISVDYANSKMSSVVVTKNNAYLNKNEPDETFDSDHELMNRGEIVDYVGVEIQQAIQTAISTAVVFKGVVADETLLPTTGQTNGDLYWITAFSANPPAGMIAGRSGSAIWNENLTPADWSYEQDNQNAPDDITLEYHTTATAQVLSVKRAGAHNGKPNALVIESDGLYVKTPVEVPELPVLTQQITIAQTTGSSLTNVSVTQATFESLISTAGSYIFLYDDTTDPSNPGWYLSGTLVDMTNYGITYTGTPVNGDAITVTLNNASGVYHLYAQNVNGTMQYSWVNDALLAVTTQNS